VMSQELGTSPTKTLVVGYLRRMERVSARENLKSTNV